MLIAHKKQGSTFEPAKLLFFATQGQIDKRKAERERNEAHAILDCEFSNYASCDPDASSICENQRKESE